MFHFHLQAWKRHQVQLFLDPLHQAFICKHILQLNYYFPLILCFFFNKYGWHNSCMNPFPTVRDFIHFFFCPDLLFGLRLRLIFVHVQYSGRDLECLEISIEISNYLTILLYEAQIWVSKNIWQVGLNKNRDTYHVLLINKKYLTYKLYEYDMSFSVWV